MFRLRKKNSFFLRTLSQDESLFERRLWCSSILSSTGAARINQNKFLAAAFNFKLLTTSLSVSPFLCQKFGSIRADVIEQMRFKQRLRVIQTIEDTTKRNVVRIH